MRTSRQLGLLDAWLPAFLREIIFFPCDGHDLQKIPAIVQERLKKGGGKGIKQIDTMQDTDESFAAVALLNGNYTMQACTTFLMETQYFIQREIQEPRNRWGRTNSRLRGCSRLNLPNGNA